MIELLPKDRTALSKDEELIIEKLYELFDQTNEPVDQVAIAFELKGTVTQVPMHLTSVALNPYVNRGGPNQRFWPTLRAAIRLWKSKDLELAWRLYDRCYAAFTPEKRELSLTTDLGLSKADATRLMWLVDREWFVSRSGPEDVIRINESILDAKNLAEHLALRSGARLERQTVTHRASTTLDAIHLFGLRSFADAQVNDLRSLTVFAGPNEAGKTNLLRALKFASGCASRGFTASVAEQGGVRALRRLAQGSERPGFRLGLRVESTPVLYGLSIEPWSLDDFLPMPDEQLIELWSPTQRVNFANDLTSLKSTLLLHQKKVHGGENQAHVFNEAEKKNETLHLQLGDSALASLQDVQRYRRANQVRNGLGSWSFFHFEPSALRSPQASNGQLREDGANLPAALLALAQDDPKRWQEVLKSFADLLPETRGLTTEPSLAGRPILELRERGLTDPLTQVDFSDGMLRILALLCLANSPSPPALVCIEEPENGLYPRLIEAMVEVLRALTNRTQVFLTTHSVTLLNRLAPEEVVFVHRDLAGSHLLRLDSRSDVKEFATRLGIGTQMLIGNLEDPTP